MRKVVSLVYAIIVIIGLLVVGCDSGDDKKEGALPVLTVGDTWIQRGLVEGIEYTLTTEVVGEDVVDGRECYVSERTSEPPLFGVISNMTIKQDKATLDIVRIQFSEEMQGEPFIMAASFSYVYSEPKFPFQMGNTWEEIETQRSTVTEMGDITTEEQQPTYTYTIEKMETITVPAGTFKCFKIVQYGDGSPLEVYWKADSVKLFDVKTYDYEDDETMELISYSVSD